MTIKNKLYSDIIVKTKELLKLNNKQPIGWDKLKVHTKTQNDLMDDIQETARHFNTLLGRIIKFQMADSHAIYIVTKTNKRTVNVHWVDYLDGWQDSRLGIEGKLDIEFVLDYAMRDDKINKLFKKI